MSKDILYKEEGFVFSYRVGGVLIENGKILLQRPIGDDYAIIGGHVARMETTAQTLAREFEEEIHAQVEVGELMAAGEIFFPWGKRDCHQIALYYRVRLAQGAQIPREGSFFGYDEVGGERTNLEFIWLPLEELAHVTVYPQELVGHILSGSGGIAHFVSDQLGCTKR